MRCQRAQQRLMAYHDSELSTGAARRLEKHLESCEECTLLLEKLRAADRHATSAVGVEEMAGIPGMPPPDDRYWESFTARVLDRVEEDAAVRAPERRRPRRKWDLMIPRMAPAFSIALVVVVAAGVMMKMGGPVPEPKVPAVITRPAPDEAVSMGDQSAPPVTAENGEREGRAAASAEEAGEKVSPYRSSPPAEAAPLKKAERVAEEEKAPEASLAPVKKSALAQPASEASPDDDRAQTTTAGQTGEARRAAEETEEPVSLAKEVPARDATPKKVDEGPAALPQPREPERTADNTIQGETSQVEEALSAEALIEEDLPEAVQAGEDMSQAKEIVSMAKPLAPSEPARVDLNEGVAAAALPAADSEEKEDVEREGAALEVAEPSEGPMGSSPGVESQSAPVMTQMAKQSFASGLPPYRGPEDQLVHARNLADVRKFWESEQVLKDLLSQNPPILIQEEASILLVKVLSGQNRSEEAQRALDDARSQFPESEKVQTFRLEPRGETPAQ